MTSRRWRAEHGIVDAEGATVAQEITLVEQTGPTTWVFDGQRTYEGGEVVVRIVANLDLAGVAPSSVVARWRSPEAELTAEHYLGGGQLVVIRGEEVTTTEAGPALLLPPLVSALGPVAATVATYAPLEVRLHAMQLDDLALERLLISEPARAAAAAAPPQPGGAPAVEWTVTDAAGARTRLLVLDGDGFVVAASEGRRPLAWGRSESEDADLPE